MIQQEAFIKLTIEEFSQWIKPRKVTRAVSKIQLHHTYIPDYSSFNGDNHFQLQSSMRDFHKQQNGWEDIGQHLTIFPDGIILTGRDFDRDPAGIYGANSGAVAIENIGNFDVHRDTMRKEQQDTILKTVAILCHKFDLEISTETIVYHHWYNLISGKRNDGSNGNKSCPGSNFFGGNKVADCRKNFLPKVSFEFFQTYQSI
ncbi:peptidoglycan recognition family protein [Olivibacter sp. 47]|uniref:peptidoglycan recognition protein family protein n=1 Tax=Olivibacter sp. 47 TaxID=3056486 RepID=UPI0025A4B58B|nr:peptidoglycan recognition family protein [Olivibacter sp. 47]MDM8173468.1 peptidoglycan recognition family protein [Olivibacter sp. 47]